MAKYKLFYNDTFIKDIDLLKENLSSWVLAYSNQTGINWYSTQTKNDDIIVQDNVSEKNFKLIYNEKR